MRRPTILLVLAGLLTCGAGVTAAQDQPSPRLPALADPNFFETLARVPAVSIYSGEPSPLFPCASAFHKDSSLLDCHEPIALHAPKRVQALIDYLATSLTWVRVKERTPVDMNAELGLRFGQGTDVVQLLVDVDHGKGRGDPFAVGQVVFWAPGQGAMKASVPGNLTLGLKVMVHDLNWVASAPPTGKPPPRSGKDILVYVEPDCSCGDLKFVYYEEAPVLLKMQRPKPSASTPSGAQVTLLVDVGRNGEVCAIRASDPVDGVTTAAVEAMKTAKFRPATLNQNPTCASVQVPVKF